MPPGNITFTQVSAGHNFSLAISTQGNIYAWGRNDHGQLGNGTVGGSASRPTLVKTPDGVTFTQVSAGERHALALASNHRLYAWGDNFYGQTGSSTNVGTTTPITEPTPVRAGDMFDNITQISAGGSHSLAVSMKQEVLAWGSNERGELGYDQATGDSQPHPDPLIVKTITYNPKITQVSAGGEFGRGYSLAIDSSGAVYAWGDNQFGQLGDGSLQSPTRPKQIYYLPHNITQVSAGYGHSLALTSDNYVYAWGSNINGELGPIINVGTDPTARPHPLAANAIPGTITQICAGSSRSIALNDAHQAYTWGNNNSSPSSTPTLVPAGAQPSSFSQVSIGRAHYLGLGTDQKVYGWGSNAFGQLGNTAASPVLTQVTPIAVTDPQLAITSVTFGSTPITNYQADAATGVWSFDVPQHPIGSVNVVITWTKNDIVQTPITIVYTYKNSFTVRFNLAGAPGTTPAAQTIPNGGNLVWPNPNPTWTGHQFTGWFTADGTP
ncbi:hypothetical protein KIMH_04190 [Bombiscardovia apis]|uniref:RCC1-like domain-containing protein n=1 Tax=Bombiscardovia apis TaxID=2932182 RepID=A0ABM8BBK4_9BIFI|nr:RCC1 domain-containing protein [Bombiscardovia apis]BDR54308.1 hypothetical protein KIMH_04190 [Bombiscardovia apis]